MRLPLVTLLVFAFVTVGLAQTPPPPAKRLPPAGIAIPAQNRAELLASTAKLRREIDEVAAELKRTGKSGLLLRLPDLEVFHKAVDWALRYDEFFDLAQVKVARHLLAEGHERAEHLRLGQTPWRETTGLVILGYRSELDDSVQPYALVVPPTWQPNDGEQRRLDVVLAGRNDKRTELAFIAEHEKSAGDIVPDNTLVLHPYGRFCNATKFAGERDVFEAMEATRAYHFDPAKVILRGFSMGGASTWHLATHFPGIWRAASPGAGFAETAIYAKVLAPGKTPPPAWEQKLWHWYDATDYAANLFNCPTIAYSGEIDPQKQSADIMETAMAREGLKLERLIGPQTAHKYHPGTKQELATRLSALVAAPRPSSASELRFVTYTLQYPRVGWIEIQGLGKHWERAEVVTRKESAGLSLSTKNVTALQLDPEVTQAGMKLIVDTQAIRVPAGHDTAQGIALVKEDNLWRVRDARWEKQHPGWPAGSKVHGATGPIDDAFMAPFVFVRPTGQPMSQETGQWVSHELAHATKLWRDIFRGDVVAKDDTGITDADLRDKNLILWGDVASNRLIARMLSRLPLEWDAKKLVFRGQTYDAGHHVPVMIFPNPLNPRRMIVLNSGMDFRDDAYGSNSLQTPKLPDYAIVDIDTPPGPKWPGRIVDAGFFDEQWKAPTP